MGIQWNFNFLVYVVWMVFYYLCFIYMYVCVCVCVCGYVCMYVCLFPFVCEDGSCFIQLWFEFIYKIPFLYLK